MKTHLIDILDTPISIDQDGVPEPQVVPPHVLIITVNEDTGEDHYEEEREYEIIHNPECLAQDCAVGWEVLHVGLDSLEDDNGLGWQDLEPGRYLIKFWAEVTRTYGGEEYESGLSIVDGPLEL